MFCNDDWHYPDGSCLAGWTREAGRLRVVYLQPGDTPGTFADHHYRQLLANAIRWAAGGPTALPTPELEQPQVSSGSPTRTRFLPMV